MLKRITQKNKLTMKKTGTKSRFLLYNILLDVIVFVLYLIVSIVAIIVAITGSSDSFDWYMYIWFGVFLFFVLHAVFILSQIFWLKKIKILKSIIYTILLFGLSYITFILPYFMIFIGLMLEGSGKSGRGFPY